MRIFTEQERENRKQRAALWREYRKHQENVRCFYEDPMTQQCGCTDDFAEDFERKERSIVIRLANLGDKRANLLVEDIVQNEFDSKVYR